MPTIDVLNYGSQEELATELEEEIRNLADVMGQNAQLEVTRREEGGSEYLYWDAGPYNWAVDLLGGENLLGLQLTNLTARSDVYVEAQNKQAIVVGEY